MYKRQVLIKDVPTDEIPSLTKAEDGGDFYVDTILGTYYISMNLQHDAFQEAKVRKALALAIDRDYIANTIMQGTYSAASNLVGPGIVDENGYFYDNANGGSPYIADDYEANLAEAKKLLEEAGYPNGEGYPTIEYSTNDAGYHVPLAEYLQQAWGDLGITLTINKMEWSSFTPARRAGEYDVARNGWVMDYNDCLLYTSDAADEEDSGDLGGRRIIKKKKTKYTDSSIPSSQKETT